MVLARLDTYIRGVPQDGRLVMTIDGALVEARTSTLPTESGERIVLRFVRGALRVPELERHQHDVVERPENAIGEPEALRRRRHMDVARTDGDGPTHQFVECGDDVRLGARDTGRYPRFDLANALLHVDAGEGIELQAARVGATVQHGVGGAQNHGDAHRYPRSAHEPSPEPERKRPVRDGGHRSHSPRPGRVFGPERGQQGAGQRRNDREEHQPIHGGPPSETGAVASCAPEPRHIPSQDTRALHGLGIELPTRYAARVHSER